MVRKTREGGEGGLEGDTPVGRPVMEISHNGSSLMICDVHFGDTRNDSTPAIDKWLPNNYPEAIHT
jgi:hypothetical protein